jgi:Zn-dependent protease with chaperone function
MKHFSSFQSPLIECCRKGFLRASPASPCIRSPRDLRVRASSLFKITQRPIFEKQTPHFTRFLPPIQAIQQRLIHPNERKKASTEWPEHIKEIILLDTEGREAINEAKKAWQREWDKYDPKGLALSLKARRRVMNGRTPFQLYINSSITGNAATFDGLTFHSEDEIGKHFWSIANPEPWSDLFARITLWMLLLCAGVFLYSQRQRVPITEQTPIKIMAEQIPSQDSEVRIENLPVFRQLRLLRVVLERLIPSSSLEHLQWRIHLVEAPREPPIVLSLMPYLRRLTFVVVINANVRTSSSSADVFVYTGILPVCHDEAGIATLLSHEMAHVVARHAVKSAIARRLYIGLVAMSYMGVLALSKIFGIGAQLLLIFAPYLLGLSGGLKLLYRRWETEADYIGLTIMWKAGYDIRGAVEFWERMKEKRDTRLQKDKHGRQRYRRVPEIADTHPHVSHDDYISKPTLI